MDFQTDTYSKKLRISRELAHKFVSVRQYLPPASAENAQLSKLNNEELQTLVLNRGLDWSMKNGLLSKLSNLCENSRLNGATVHVHIKTDTWESIVYLLQHLDEWDLIEECLRAYIAEIENRRCLP